MYHSAQTVEILGFIKNNPGTSPSAITENGHGKSTRIYDLIKKGLVEQSGKGKHATYTITSEGEKLLEFYAEHPDKMIANRRKAKKKPPAQPEMPLHPLAQQYAADMAAPIAWNTELVAVVQGIEGKCASILSTDDMPEGKSALDQFNAKLLKTIQQIHALTKKAL